MKRKVLQEELEAGEHEFEKRPADKAQKDRAAEQDLERVQNKGRWLRQKVGRAVAEGETCDIREASIESRYIGKPCMLFSHWYVYLIILPQY